MGAGFIRRTIFKVSFSLIFDNIDWSLLHNSVNDIPGELRLAIQEKQVNNEIPKRKKTFLELEDDVSSPVAKRRRFSFTSPSESFQSQSAAMIRGGATCSSSLSHQGDVSSVCVFVPKNLLHDVMMFISSRVISQLSSPMTSSASSSTTTSPSHIVLESNPIVIEGDKNEMFGEHSSPKQSDSQEE